MNASGRKCDPSTFQCQFDAMPLIRDEKKSIFDYKMYIPYLSPSYPDKILLSVNV